MPCPCLPYSVGGAMPPICECLPYVVGLQTPPLSECLPYVVGHQFLPYAVRHQCLSYIVRCQCLPYVVGRQCLPYVVGCQVHFDVVELSGLQKRFQAMKTAGLGIDRKGLASLLARLNLSILCGLQHACIHLAPHMYVTTIHTFIHSSSAIYVCN